MLCKDTNCAEHVSVNTRPRQLHRGDQDMGTAISCTKCGRVAVMQAKQLAEVLLCI